MWLEKTEDIKCCSVINAVIGSLLRIGDPSVTARNLQAADSTGFCGKFTAKIMVKSYFLKGEGEHVTQRIFREFIEHMKQKSFWETDELRMSLINMLLKHCLSKFQDCLPEPFQAELMANEFYDFHSAIISQPIIAQF